MLSDAERRALYAEHLHVLEGGRAYTPWPVYSLLAPGIDLAAISDFMGLAVADWRLVAGLWEQEVDDGLWRLDIHDSVLLFSPLYDGALGPSPLPSGRGLPLRRVDLGFVPTYLERAGLQIEWLKVRGASQWVMDPDTGAWDGYLAARGEVSTQEASWGRRRLVFEACAHGEIWGPDRPTSIRLAEVVLGLRMYR